MSESKRPSGCLAVVVGLAVTLVLLFGLAALFDTHPGNVGFALFVAGAALVLVTAARHHSIRPSRTRMRSAACCTVSEGHEELVPRACTLLERVGRSPPEVRSADGTTIMSATLAPRAGETGLHVTVTIRSDSSGSSCVCLQSRSVLPGALFDGGENRDTVVELLAQVCKVPPGEWQWLSRREQNRRFE